VQDARASLQSKVKELQAEQEAWAAKEAQRCDAAAASAVGGDAELQAAREEARELSKAVEHLSGQLIEGQVGETVFAGVSCVTPRFTPPTTHGHQSACSQGRLNHGLTL
jgi:hypothetical protein